MEYKNFFIVSEQTSPEDSKIEILDCVERNNTLHYLRFRACLQSFLGRNRNKRLWKSAFIKTMIAAPHIQELLKKGGVPGEAGHPVPITGEVTIERIVTIEPEKMSHKINSFQWNSDESLVFGEIETLDDIDGPGAKFARNILQKMEPSFSARTLVPQRKHPNGNIDVLGPGRLICYDRVILPSHEEAYRDVSVPIKNIVKVPNLETSMESAIQAALEAADAYAILESMDPVLSTARIDNTGTLSVVGNEGLVIIPNPGNLRNDIKDFMKRF